MPFSSVSSPDTSYMDDETSLMGPAYRAAAFVCLLGVFLRIFISGPVLGLLGIDIYVGMTKSIFTYVNIGSYFIYLSFFLLILDQGDPLARSVDFYRQHRAFFFFAAINILVFFYWGVRKPDGFGLMIDTHIPIPLSAIVLSHAPRSYCRNAIKLLVSFGVTNAVIGIIEAFGKFRIFTFDPKWVVMQEDYFRASAFLGHPLDNAVFTSIILFTVLFLKGRPLLKAFAIAVLVTGLVAFGGRTALAFSVFGLVTYGFYSLKESFRRFSLVKLFFVLALATVAPMLLIGGLYLALTSSMGERFLALHSLSDSSAEARTVVLEAFDYMTRTEFFFGIGGDRITDIIYRVGGKDLMSDIENPWVLLMIQFGAVFFMIWLAGLLVFVLELMSKKPFILRLLIVIYFVVASAFNSFGRKDFLFLVMVMSVICAARGFEIKQNVDRSVSEGSA